MGVNPTTATATKARGLFVTSDFNWPQPASISMPRRTRMVAGRSVGPQNTHELVHVVFPRRPTVEFGGRVGVNHVHVTGEPLQSLAQHSRLFRGYPFDR